MKKEQVGYGKDKVITRATNWSGWSRGRILIKSSLSSTGEAAGPEPRLGGPLLLPAVQASREQDLWASAPPATEMGVAAPIPGILCIPRAYRGAQTLREENQTLGFKSYTYITCSGFCGVFFLILYLISKGISD